MAQAGSEQRYETRRGQLQHYFDHTALENWKQLTSTSPVGRIRQSVRDGRDSMRQLLLNGLPSDLSDSRVLDAGCGTGALAWAAAERGASVVAVDLSPNLVELAAARPAATQDSANSFPNGDVQFASGDMLSDQWGEFDHTVCMDSLIHYHFEDTLDAIMGLASRTRHSLQFTIAPATRLLLAMHRVGQWLPRQNRSPDIQPILIPQLEEAIIKQMGPMGWSIVGCERVSSGFYKSQAFHLVRQ